MDESGKIDILDVITLNKSLMGKEKLTEQGTKNADVTKDDNVNASDAIDIMKYIVGLITKF